MNERLSLSNAFARVVLVLLVLLLASACNNRDSETDRGSLLVFCGVTMINPVLELAERFEERHNVDMELTYGGSQDLAKSIQLNQLGDIYFPGFRSFVDDMSRKGHVANSTLVGHNQLALFVPKGNPRFLSGDLSELLKDDLAVVIGHEDLGSVGQETKRVLNFLGLYDRVVRNAAFMASDSKGLSAAIRDGRADAVLNWKAVHMFKKNREFMDVIPIVDVADLPRPLVIASLVHSNNPEMAQAFLDLCASDQGQAVFRKYGF